MFALGHFIFMLVKIALLSSVYATLMVTVMYVFSKVTKSERLKRWIDKKFVTWWLTGLSFSVGLLIFSFSYWGNHGVGDSSRIPVGHGQVIHNGDGVWTYFYPNLDKPRNQKRINNFVIKGDRLCAEQKDHKYLVYDFSTFEIVEFENKHDYEKFAHSNNLPLTIDFKDFIVHYHAFWSGWRFYLLP
jgi:hypothetical protein